MDTLGSKKEAIDQEERSVEEELDLDKKNEEIDNLKKQIVQLRLKVRRVKDIKILKILNFYGSPMLNTVQIGFESKAMSRYLFNAFFNKMP